MSLKVKIKSKLFILFMCLSVYLNIDCAGRADLRVDIALINGGVRFNQGNYEHGYLVATEIANGQYIAFYQEPKSLNIKNIKNANNALVEIKKIKNIKTLRSGTASANSTGLYIDPGKNRSTIVDGQNTTANEIRKTTEPIKRVIIDINLFA